jgi:dihydrofolate reductase
MISMIWAMGKNNALGCRNRMPWYLPGDFAYFKRVTMGKPVIMGRKTFESIGKPLPGRTNIIITRDAGFKHEGCIAVNSIDGARAYAAEGEVFIIGGAEIYTAFLPLAHKLYITEIDHTFEADTYFPEIDYSQWELVSSEQGIKDEKNPYDYKFLVFERKK